MSYFNKNVNVNSLHLKLCNVDLIHNFYHIETVFDNYRWSSLTFWKHIALLFWYYFRQIRPLFLVYGMTRHETFSQSDFFLMFFTSSPFPLQGCFSHQVCCVQRLNLLHFFCGSPYCGKWHYGCDAYIVIVCLKGFLVSHWIVLP